MAKIKIYPDASQLAAGVAEQFASLARESVEDHESFLVALSGGTTPRDAYSLLASEPLASRVDWSKAQLFWGDERCVPPGSPDSNYGLAKRMLLDKVSIPAGNVHRIRGELPPDQAAEEYQKELRTIAAGRNSRDTGAVLRFDLILLGMGEDGHTASLFPGTPALKEQDRWVVAQYVGKLAAWRVSFTPLLINAAANITIMVSGEGKAERLKQALEEPVHPEHLPVQAIRPASGRLLWMADAAAAALIEPS